MTTPPFAYFGGKTRLAGRIVAMLPRHEHYVEPFGGSLAVLLAKPRSAMETVNDLDRDLMTFWRVLRDQPDELMRACALTPHAELYDGWHEVRIDTTTGQGGTRQDRTEVLWCNRRPEPNLFDMEDTA